MAGRGRGRSIAANPSRIPTLDPRYDYCACILRSLRLAEEEKENSLFREWGESLALEGEYLTD